MLRVARRHRRRCRKHRRRESAAASDNKPFAKRAGRRPSNLTIAIPRGPRYKTKVERGEARDGVNTTVITIYDSPAERRRGTRRRAVAGPAQVR